MAHTEVAFLAEAFMVVVAIASFFVGFPHLWNERLRRRGVKSRGVCVSHSVPRGGKVSCLIWLALG